MLVQPATLPPQFFHKSSMEQSVQGIIVLAITVISTVLLSGCDLFDQTPHEIEVKHPNRGATLSVGEPFRVQARFDNERTIRNAHVEIYRNSSSSSHPKDTVFTAPLSIPNGSRSFSVDTTLTIKELPGSFGDNFTLFIYVRGSGKIGAGVDVAIQKRRK